MRGTLIHLPGIWDHVSHTFGISNFRDRPTYLWWNGGRLSPHSMDIAMIVVVVAVAVAVAAAVAV